MPHGKDKKKGKGDGSMVAKAHFINSNSSSGSAYRVRVADDLSRGPLVPDLSRIRMPKKMQTQIHWFQTTAQASTALVNNNITELNYQFSMANTAISAGIAALFDQYAIFAVYIRTIISNTSPVSTNSQTYTTAIDYDNVANLGSQASLQGYSTSNTTGVGEVQERYIEPCNAPALYSGSTFSHYGQSRMWVDCANTGTPHYGHRCIVSNLGSGVTGLIVQEVTYVICARNVI